MSQARMRKALAISAAVAVAVPLAGCQGGGSDAGSDGKQTIVIASVNNGPMMTMQELAPEFTKETGIDVKFVMLTENDIRSKIQQDVAVKGGQFDLVTLGTSDTPTYLDSGWTEPLQPLLDKMSADEKTAYDEGDLITGQLAAFTSEKNGLAGIPLYGESTMIMYRKDLFEAAGLTMPEEPTWDQIYDFAKKLNDPSSGTVGMAMRGKAGYGENMYIFNTIMNAYGASIADMDWKAGYDTPEMAQAWEFYRKLQKDAGAPDASSNGYTETLNLMSSGKAGIYYDATVSADTFEGDGSAVKGKMGYAMSPSGPGKGNTQTVGGWSIALTSSSKHKDAAFKFITWVTSKDYVKLVADKKGWLNVPTGARKSTYEAPEYQALAPYASLVLKSLENVDFNHPAVPETPYVGNSLPSIPEWSGLGEKIGQDLAEYISSDVSTKDALAKAQDAATQAFKDGGRTK
ncbi:MAG: sugar ABC transporter substrate-binding protein [Microbacterium sp.]